MKSINIKKKLASQWFRGLRDQICKEFENLEKIMSKKNNKIFKN